MDTPPPAGNGSAPAATAQLKLVGAANFVRRNPRTDRFQVHKFHSIEFWCSDATNTFKRFQHALGMTLVAKSDLSTSNTQFASYVMQSNDLVFTFTAPYSRVAWKTSGTPSSSSAPAAAPSSSAASKPSSPLPHYDQNQAHEFIAAHGLAVRAVGLNVEDAEVAFKSSVENGAIPVLPPTLLTDAATGKISTISEVKLYGDVVLRYVSGSFQGPFLPGYEPVSDSPKISYGVTRIDHAVGNVHHLEEAVRYIAGFTGFHEFAEFTTEDVGTLDSGLNSMVLASNNELVLLPINEPTHGTPRKSQIQTYLEQNEGPGLQHLALKTNDIFRTLKEMQSRSQYGGFEFMPKPSAKYYKELPNKIGDVLTSEQYKMLEEMGILADIDDQGVLLQIFTKPLGDRPTIFIEIIERIGCLHQASPSSTSATTGTPAEPSGASSPGEVKVTPGASSVASHTNGTMVKASQGMVVDREDSETKGGKWGEGSGGKAPVHVLSLGVEQAAGCGGFGKGNFSELFKRIEEYERTLSI